MKAPLPANELQRLQALRSYDILDTPPELVYDDITALASEICDTPIALVSLVDESRQWFKSRVGMEASETPREMAVCAHALAGNGLLYVPDLTKDERFADNPLVVGEAALRFYAGAPLTTLHGETLGTLCVIDKTPRELTEKQQHALQVLSRQVTAQMELHRQIRLEHSLIDQLRASEKILRESEERYRLLFERSPYPMWVYDLETLRFLAVNDTAVANYGYSRNEFLEMTIKDIRPPGEVPALLEKVAAMAATGEGNQLEVWTHLKKDGGKLHVEISSHALIILGKSARLVQAQDVSLRRQIEQNQYLLRVAGKMARIGGWSIEMPDRELAWSDEIYAFLDVPRSYQLVLENTLEFNAPEARATVRRYVEACATDGTPFEFELPMTTAKGRKIWARVIGEAVRDGHGKITHLQGALQDITQNRQTQLDLDTVSSRLFSTMEGMLDAFYLLDTSWRFVYLNQEAEKLLRRKRQDLLGQIVWDKCPESVAPEIHVQYRKAVATQTPVEFEFFYPEVESWFELKAYPSSEGLSVYFRDISSRKQTQERIAEQAALLNSAHEGIIVKNMQEEITYWNKGAERLFGWTAEEALGRKPVDFLYTDPAIYQSAYAEVLARGEYHGETLKQTKAGEKITVETRWSLVRDEKGQPKSVLVINLDVTEKKKMESQFLRAQRMEGIGTLASGIAHDLNNILAPILMSLEVLKMKYPEAQADNLLDTLLSSAQRGADLVGQVLSFARGVESQRLVVNPAHILRDIQKVARDTFPKSITFDLQIPPDIWTVLGDPTQLHQVFLNLCVNARDAMPAGGKISIDVKNVVLDETYVAMNPGSLPGVYVVATVTDTGTGISPEVRDKIFEPFFTTKEIGKGTGLGLSTTIAIIKSHKGFINLYSEIHQGTTFTVYLPAQSQSSAAEEVALEQTSLPRGDGEIILVVDDENAILVTVKSTLERFGYRVLLANNGAEAVAAYVRQGEAIAAVLTDMTMPIMDGPATITALHALNPDVKILASSGLAVNSQIAKAMGAGVTHFVPKPYTAETLLQKLRIILEEKRPTGVIHS